MDEDGLASAQHRGDRRRPACARINENLLRSCGYMAQTYLSAELFLASEGLSRSNCIITDLEMRQMPGRNFSSASEAAAAILRSSS